MFSKYSSVHLHRSEVGQDHQLALAGESKVMNKSFFFLFNSSSHLLLGTHMYHD